MSFFVGIDPGGTGAIAAIHERLGTCLGVWDMPDDEHGLLGLRDIIASEHGTPKAIALEKADARPKQGVSSTFKFGKNFGWCCLWAASWGVRWDVVTPQKWKKHHGLLKKEKIDSLHLARRLWPNAPLGAKRHIGRAEALLIAEWGRKNGKSSGEG